MSTADKRCGKCDNCKELERVKRSVLRAVNPPFSHADDGVVNVWNTELARLPCTDEWAMFTKRTEDPKLAWLERKLGEQGIPHRRNGSSFHAPILEVTKSRLEDAWLILAPVDDIEDDDPRWTEE